MNPHYLFPELATRAAAGDRGIRRIDKGDIVISGREYLARRRLDIRALHRSGASGGNVVRALTGLADEMVRGIVEIGLCRLGITDSFKKRYSVCALGGYGRQQLNPHSDLDIAIIAKRKADKHVEELNRFIIPFLWDIGYENSCVLRTAKECIALAREDTRVFTGLLESRLLMGSPDPSVAVRMAVLGFKPEDIPDRFNELLKRADENSFQTRFRDLYAAEPNVKENPGGLRDYHAALWLFTMATGVRTIDNIRGAGYITGEEQLELAEALDMIWRIRNELHFAAGKSEDRLTYENAARVAIAFGYTGPDQRDCTRLMEDYYAAARRIRRFLEAAVRVCRPTATPKRRAAADTKPKELDVRDGQLYLTVNDDQWFAENPARLMSVVWECARRGVPLSHAAERKVRANLSLVNESFQTSDLVRRFFLAICNRPLTAGAALRQAAECGLLDLYLPEFAAVRDIIRYEDFHHYPVDEHTIRAVEALATIPASEGIASGFLKMALEHLQDPYILVLSLLLHDLGKVEGEEHSVAGMRIARDICKRIGLPQEDEDRIAFLVEHHLLMTQIALYRDIDDDEVVRRFTATVKSVDRLTALFLLSFADMSAVGPNVWTDWKGTLLLNLYLASERMLLGRTRAPQEAFWLHPKADAIRELLPESERAVVEKHLQDMGDRYFAIFPADQIATHIECLRTAEAEGLAVRTLDDAQADVTTVIVCTRDHPGLFEQIAGCFAAQLIDVQGAAAFTRPDGLAVDSFTVTSAERRKPLSPHQVRAFEKTLQKVILEREDVREHIAKARSRIFGLLQETAAVPTRIVFDNESSSTSTVIDIEAADRTGLLYDIVSAMSAHELDISSARIVTDARRVRDAFYVTCHTGRIETLEAQDELKRAIMAAIHMRPAVEQKGELV